MVGGEAAEVRIVAARSAVNNGVQICRIDQLVRIDYGVRAMSLASAIDPEPYLRNHCHQHNGQTG